MAASGDKADDSLYPIAVLIDELKNEDIQVSVNNNFHQFKVQDKIFNRGTEFSHNIALFLKANSLE